LSEPLSKLYPALAFIEQFDSLLNFCKGNDAHELGLAIGGLKPSLHAAIWSAWTIVFRENIRIDEKPPQLKIGRARKVFIPFQVEVGSGEGGIQKELGQIFDLFERPPDPSRPTSRATSS
jgi:hypothetical protein